MFGLPKSTEINKPLSKKAVFDKFKPTSTNRRLFDDQINRMAIVAEISPHTVSLAVGKNIATVYVILVTLKVADCDKKNVVLLSKMIDQRMVFALQHEDIVQLAVYHLGRVLISECKPIDEWRLNLRGFDLDVVWENIIAEIGGIDLVDGKSLDETIVTNERREKLISQITTMEKKAMNERQPRRKWEYAEEIKQLKEGLAKL